MARVRFIRSTEAKITSAPIADGVIYVSSDTGKMFVDNGSVRQRIGVSYTLSKSGNTITLTGNDGSSSSVTDDNTTYSVATSSSNGLMSAADKQKLDTLDTTSYELPLASDSTRGGVKIGYTENNKNYPVELDSSERMYVNVPWTDTTYTAGTGLGMISNGFYILNGGVGLNQLADDSVSESKLADGAVDTAKIADGAVTAEKIANGVIPTVSLEALGVTATATELNYTDGVTSNIQTQLNGKAASSHTHDNRYYTETEIDSKLATKANTSHTHAASDVTSGTFDINRLPTITDAKISSLSASKITGTIPQANLPSYVDDVLEYNGISNFPDSGETGKIYVDTATNKTYRWGGSGYVEISASLALGTTSSTAYRGDYGNTAYQHATAKGSAFSSGLYKITTNAQGHVTAATAVTKSDITALGIPGSDTNTNTTYTLSKSGNTITLSGSDGSSTSVTDANTTYTLASFGINATAAELNVLDGITATTAELNYCDGVTSNIQNQLNAKAASSHTHNYAGSSSAGGAATTAVALTSSAGSATQPVYFSGGKPVACTYTIAKSVPANAVFTDTTYNNMTGATSSTAGAAGLVPAPAAGKQTSFLRGDGTWVVPTNTTYAQATSSVLGLIKIGYTESGKNYPVELNSSGQAFVNVPWTDTNTTYTLSSFGITATAAELNKLDGVTTTATQLNYLNTLTSNVQTQLNGKAASSHTHSYLPLSGGTLTGTLTARAIKPAADSTYDIGTSTVRYKNIYADTFTGALSGNASTASKLATARTISLSGAVSGSGSFDGSGNITIATTSAAGGGGTVLVSDTEPTDSNVTLWIKP